MRSKNAPALTADEREHVARVKSCACVLCDHSPPVEAHHVIQGDHFTTISVCTPCHRGPMGIHGDQTMLRIRFKATNLRGEMLALNETLRRVAALDE